MSDMALNLEFEQNLGSYKVGMTCEGICGPNYGLFWHFGQFGAVCIGPKPKQGHKSATRIHIRYCLTRAMWPESCVRFQNLMSIQRNSPQSRALDKSWSKSSTFACRDSEPIGPSQTEFEYTIKFWPYIWSSGLKITLRFSTVLDFSNDL